MDGNSLIRHNSNRQMSQKITQHRIPKLLAISASSYFQYLSQFLGTSTGRDKFMAFFQYAFDFYYSCAKHSNIDYVQVAFALNDMKSALVANSFQESISQARKIYRMMKFLDEIKGIKRIPKMNKPQLFKLLCLTGHLASFMYYVSDNTLWAVGLMVRNGVLMTSTEYLWKNSKNKFSQMNVIVNMIRLSVLLVLRSLQIVIEIQISKENKLLSELWSSSSQKIEKGGIPCKKLLSLLKLRRKRRFEIIDLTVSLLRFFMLTKSLKMNGYQYLHPIFVATCGLVSALISIFKSVYEKQIFIQLDKSKFIEKPDMVGNLPLNKPQKPKLKVGSVVNFQD